jgi:ketosteroid isomerase-like protein
MKCRVFICVTLALCVTPLLGAQDKSLTDIAAETTIRQLEQQWERALLQGDQAAINRIVAEDCLFVSSSGELLTKAQADSDRRKTVLKVSIITDMNVRVIGDVAIVIGANREASTYGDQDTSGRYRWTDIFARRGGQWKVVSAHSTRIDEPVSAAAVARKP